MFNTAQLNRIEELVNGIAELAILISKDLDRLLTVLPYEENAAIVAPKKRGRPFKNACDLCSFKGKNKQSVAQHKRHNHKAI